jgi:hypothetical protein
LFIEDVEGIKGKVINHCSLEALCVLSPPNRTKLIQKPPLAAAE